jgi:hypothetical protein
MVMARPPALLMVELISDEKLITNEWPKGGKILGYPGSIMLHLLAALYTLATISEIATPTS